MRKNPEDPKLDSFLIAIIFIISGISLFVISVFSGSQIICFIGLGLTFWGALFVLAPPTKHVEASFLVTSSLPGYMNLDRMLNCLISKNEAYNIPPCPDDVSLPEHLKGLKEMVTFIPAIYTDGIAEIEDIAKGKFLVDKPKGLLITSPGVSLLDKIEKKHKTDFAKIPPSELDVILPGSFSSLYLAKEIEMTTNENEIILRINGSLYKNLYSPKYNLKSIKLLGCPLVNAIACAIAKSTGKPTKIQELKTTSKGKSITAILNTVQTKEQPVDLENWVNGTREEQQKSIDVTQSADLENLVALPEEKPKGLLVTKAEVVDNTVRFFVETGFLRKRCVIVKEIPVYEIVSIENFGNELTVTWKNETFTFFTNKNAELFVNLCDEVNRMREEQQKSIDVTQSADLENLVALPEEKPKGLLVTKAEVVDNTVRFFVETGFLRKRCVIVKEIPVYEIVSIENFGNELTVTWKNETFTFFTNKNAELFVNLCDEVNRMREEQQKSTDSWKVALRRNELLAVIDASVGIIDFSFNILIGLRKKRIDWQQLKDYSSKDLIGFFNFKGQLMPPMSISFLKISLAIKSQKSEEASEEAYNILKVIYSYFDSLSTDDDVKESVPNFLSARAIVLSYYALNDLILGKVVGMEEDNKENHQLESVLQILENNTNFKVNVCELKTSIDKLIPNADLESVIENIRQIFKEQFLLLVYKSL
jgi:hypothetical protein